jgi:uncharacterized protein (UPF0335 family)
MNNEELQNIISRIEKKDADIKLIRGDINEIYKEANALGYSPKALKMIVKYRKDVEKAKEELGYVRAYSNALQMELF